MIHLTLPYPPTANHIWKTGRGNTYCSTAYRLWRSRALAAIPDSARGHITGPYIMTAMYDRPDRRKRDLGNLLKSLEDLLKADPKQPHIKGVIRDDSDAQSIQLSWSSREPGKDAAVRVFIEPIAEAA